MLDTSVVIHLREGDPAMAARYVQLAEQPAISIVTQVELWGGIAGLPIAQRAAREAVTRELLSDLEVVPFERFVSETYFTIVKQLGFNRSLILDRMIAATAITLNAVIVTTNARDFRTIRGLIVEDWSN